MYYLGTKQKSERKAILVHREAGKPEKKERWRGERAFPSLFLAELGKRICKRRK
jgi:hypothetical protein